MCASAGTMLPLAADDCLRVQVSMHQQFHAIDAQSLEPAEQITCRKDVLLKHLLSGALTSEHNINTDMAERDAASSCCVRLRHAHIYGKSCVKQAAHSLSNCLQMYQSLGRHMPQSKTAMPIWRIAMQQLLPAAAPGPWGCSRGRTLPTTSRARLP